MIRQSVVMALLLLCGFCFLALLIFVGSLVEACKMIWACRPAWPLMLAIWLILIVSLGFWPGFGVWFFGFWMVAFVSSDQWDMIRSIVVNG